MNDILMQLDARGLIVIALKATLLIAGGWCAARLLRRASAVARHTIWLGVIVGAVVVPLFARVGPIEIPVLAPEPVVSNAAPRDVATAAAPTTTSAPAPSADASTIRAAASHWTSRAMAIAIWTAMTLLILAWFARGMIAVRGIARRGRLLKTPAWGRAIARAARRVDMHTLPRVVMSDEVDVAFACNALTPTIVLPVGAEEWTDDLRHTVLAHELAHIKRRDLFSQSAATVACAMYWFNPLVWSAARRLREESELASDDMVLESGVRPADYAQHLLSLVTTLRRSAPAAALAVARPREFEGRLVAILDRAHRRSTLGKARQRAMLGALGVMTVSVGVVAPVPRTVQATMVQSVADSARNARSEAAAPERTPRGGQPVRLSDAGISVLLRRGASAVANPMQTMLRFADSLALDGRQADSIATLSRAYSVALDQVWRPVLHYYATHAVDDERPGDDALRDAQIASIDLLARFAPHINSLLSAEQREKVPAEAARWLDAHELSALRHRAASEPDVVFDLPRRAGARVGGGGAVTRPTRGRAG